ncbi:RNA polymerase sigma factor (sigma-70 family) [Anoxybacillus vitaminiphilus]|uniref:RNA polymerase sigma factor (Sigma-70 family) n=1 Tax=Paranoxybacillus vitaminiphilus TaxID=581036 RepID=A0A327YJB9_9BACL|nr:sigma-70 family RNA polymerase sigma factor [Anoxybacillus vitaminiphilus]RAK21118.1 RNA polymerase sigma factor (sigma-70 family) [Anoxybacillus vitaminiphilus]
MSDLKDIILRKGSIQTMSFEQVFQRYQNLLKKKAYSWSTTYRYEFDELFQVASIALWQAYRKYDSSKYPIPFGALAVKYIDYSLLAYHNKHKPKFDRETSQIKSIMSLHQLVIDKDGEGTELMELIGQEETFTEETVDRIVIDSLFKKFSNQQRQDILDYINGHKFKEMAESKGVSSQVVSSRIRSSFLKFRTMYIKEMLS